MSNRDDEIDHDVVSAVGGFLNLLNEDSRMRESSKEWNLAVTFSPRDTENSLPVHVLVDRSGLRLVDSPPRGAREVEVAADPHVMVDVCSGRVLLSEAISKGEVEIVRGSLADLLRMKAILDRLVELSAKGATKGA